MRIGIDISQIVYEGTGVAKHVEQIVANLLKADTKNQYILFGSSFRQRSKLNNYIEKAKRINSTVRSIILPFPIKFFEYLWNKLHIIPIEWLIGPVNVFWSSDWTQPPLIKALGVTTIHDLSIYRFPREHDINIVKVQKRRLKQAKKECQLFFCDSEKTKEDARGILNIPADKLFVVYPGIN